MTRSFHAGAATRPDFGMGAGVAFLATLAFFWPTLASFPETWTRHGMAFGWLMVGLVAWLAWRDRATLLEGRGGDPLLLIPITGLSFLWLGATVAHIQVGHQATFVLLFITWGLAVFGWSAARTVLLIGTTFMLALPMWDSLVPVLRPLTIATSGGLVTLLGISTDIEGDVIRIAAGTFLIEDGCAGLDYFRAAVIIAVFYAHILVRGWRAKLAVIGLAGALAIVGNWIRVAALIVIGHVTEMQSNLMVDHIAFGWMIFAGGLIPFLFLAGHVERREEARTKYRDRTPQARELGAGTAVPPETAVPSRSRGPLGILERTGAASAAAIAGPVLYFTFASLPPADAMGMALRDLPAGPGWEIEQAERERPFSWKPAFAGAEEHELASFTDGTLRVYGDRFVYREQAQGAKLIGYPNRIAPSAAVVDERLTGPVDGQGRLRVRQAIIRSSEETALLTWYWYRVGARDTPSQTVAKLLEIPAFFTRQRQAELIAFTVPCEPNDCRTAAEVLAAFTGGREVRPP